MKVTLKGIKSFQGPDGECFTAKVCFDGKVVGSVSNDGWGGCNSYTLSDKDMALLIAEANKAGEKGPECEDVFIESLMCEIDALKEHKKNLKKGFKCTAWVRLGQWESGYIRLLDKANLEKHLKANKATLIKLFEGEV